MRLPKVRKGGCTVDAARDGKKQRSALTKALILVGTQGRKEKVLQSPSRPSPQPKVANQGVQLRESRVRSYPGPA